MERGYIRLWRKTLDSGLLQSGPAWQLFGYLMLKATHKPVTCIVSGQMVKLAPGQAVFGRVKAAADLDLSERNIRTALKLLENMEIVTSKATNRFTVITFVNWNAYQCERPADDQQNDQQTTSTRPACDHVQEQENKNKNIRTPPTPQGGASADTPAGKKKRSKPEFPPCPYGQLFDMYQECLPEQPFDPVWEHDESVKAKVRKLWGFFFKRIALKAKAEGREAALTQEAGLKYAKAFFASAGKDEFFVGKEWYSILWLCGQTNATKVISRAKAKQEAA